MGLDQYLYCNSKTVCKAANKAIGGEKWHEFCGVCAYWRKANQIHGWFVEHVQYGEDDCGMYEVTVGDLKELLETVDTVLGSTRLVDGTIVTGYRLDGEGSKPIYKNGKVLEGFQRRKRASSDARRILLRQHRIRPVLLERPRIHKERNRSNTRIRTQGQVRDVRGLRERGMDASR